MIPGRHIHRTLALGVAGLLVLAAGGALSCTGHDAKKAKGGLAKVPAPYATMTRPKDTIPPKRTKILFKVLCAQCHGQDGKGHGPAGIALDPKPAALSAPGFLHERSDDYLFWRISEGVPGSAMPAFKHNLKAAQRWALIGYLRERWDTKAAKH